MNFRLVVAINKRKVHFMGAADVSLPLFLAACRTL
jgi:hypothetical protein